MQKLIQLKNKKGFTLIEMLIVILIIVILLAIAVPSVIAYREDSQRTADLGAAKTVYTALEATLTTFGELPGTHGNWFKTQTGTDIIYYQNYNNGNLRIIAAGVVPYHFDFGIAVNSQLGADVQGKYKFGYDTTTNSIAWVSYHQNDYTTNDTLYYAPDANVMVYDIANGVSGYADELGAPYNALPYSHE